MNRRNFLKYTAAGAAVVSLPPHLLGQGQALGTNAKDEDLLAACKERIAQYRQGAGEIVVRDKDGRPVPGATVKVEQSRHDFLFGSNCFRLARISDAEREKAYREKFSALLNYATLGFYWSSYEPEKGQPGYAYSDQVAEWCQANGIAAKGHPLVWDYVPDPKWLPQDFEGIQRESQGRVREIVSRFKGRIDRWDVVNEPTHLGRSKTKMAEWAMSLGAARYVAEHLKVARAANPQALLLVNDYRTDDPFYKILDELRESGQLLFDAVGIQSHMHDGGWPLRRVWEVCDRYARLSLPIHFTETTIVSGPRRDKGWGATTAGGETYQADYVPKFYTMLFAHPSVEAITWWDFSDDRAWQGAPAGWIRNDMSPKPVYDRLMGLIKGEWWTRTEGQTNGQGQYALRAFYGLHNVTVKVRERTTVKSAQWKKGGENRVEVIV